VAVPALIPEELSMSMRMPMVFPEPPTGLPVGSYDRYEKAQAAVDYLSDKGFAVQHLTIVGKDLAQVERVTGRWDAGKAMRAGGLTGAMWGLFIGLLFAIFGSGLIALIVTIPIGAIFGIFNGWLLYRSTGGRRDFTSATQVVASSYEVLCQHQHAEEARTILAQYSLQAGNL
jgi:hypothetical protein